jgi:hypothetical protein
MKRFACSTRTSGLTEEQRARQSLAGAILVLEPGVRGLPEARFRG